MLALAKPIRSTTEAGACAPAAVGDASFPAQFDALWCTNMGAALRRFEAILGRPLASDRSSSEAAPSKSNIDSPTRDLKPAAV